MVKIYNKMYAFINSRYIKLMSIFIFWSSTFIKCAQKDRLQAVL